MKQTLIKHYMPEIDVLKGLAIGAVVVIHLISGFGVSIAADDSWSSIFLLVNQMARFSVPLFVMLSGYVLAHSFMATRPSWRRFFYKRLVSVLPLYVLWSGLFMVWFYGMRWQGAQGLPWLDILLLGKGDYQLYFVPMIFQLYLLFPLLYPLARFKRVGWLIVALSFGLQLVSFWWFNHLGWHDQSQYILASTWIGYFVLGIRLTQIQVPAWINRQTLQWGLLGLAGGALTFMLIDAVVLIRTGLDVLVATRFTRMSVWLYAIIMGLLLFLVRGKFTLLPGVVRGGLEHMGKHSYLIYLSHTLWLRLLIDGMVKGSLDMGRMWLLVLLLMVGIGGSQLWDKRLAVVFKRRWG
jgi:probable poly-beta-1,6-N-acetyl-D-glucosamine export protein